MPSYFLPLAYFAVSETCFFSFLLRFFSRCSCLCFSNPAAFFSLLDKASTFYREYAGHALERFPFCFHSLKYALTLSCSLTSLSAHTERKRGISCDSLFSFLFRVTRLSFPGSMGTFCVFSAVSFLAKQAAW